jgi:hypothetical protein
MSPDPPPDDERHETRSETMAFHPEDLPRVSQWSSDGGDAVRTFIEQEVGASAAIALTTLFWPLFVEVDGAVLLADRFSTENLRAWQATLGSDVRAIEGVINHVHLWDVFNLNADRVPDDALLYFAGVLRQTWQAALRTQFPARDFDVTVASGDEEYGPTIYAVSRGPSIPEDER